MEITPLGKSLIMIWSHLGPQRPRTPLVIHNTIMYWNLAVPARFPCRRRHMVLVMCFFVVVVHFVANYQTYKYSRGSIISPTVLDDDVAVAQEVRGHILIGRLLVRSLAALVCMPNILEQHTNPKLFSNASIHQMLESTYVRKKQKNRQKCLCEWMKETSCIKRIECSAREDNHLPWEQPGDRQSYLVSFHEKEKKKKTPRNVLKTFHHFF